MRERALDLWSTAISKPGLTTFSSSQGSSSNTVTDRFFGRYLASLPSFEKCRVEGYVEKKFEIKSFNLDESNRSEFVLNSNSVIIRV